MSEINVVTHVNLVRDQDHKSFSSPHGQLHNGKKVERLRALTPDDENSALRSFWKVDVAQTVCRIVDTGEEIVLLNDECRHGG